MTCCCTGRGLPALAATKELAALVELSSPAGFGGLSICCCVTSRLATLGGAARTPWPTCPAFAVVEAGFLGAVATEAALTANRGAAAFASAAGLVAPVADALTLAFVFILFSFSGFSFTLSFFLFLEAASAGAAEDCCLADVALAVAAPSSFSWLLPSTAASLDPLLLKLSSGERVASFVAAAAASARCFDDTAGDVLRKEFLVASFTFSFLVFALDFFTFSDFPLLAGFRRSDALLAGLAAREELALEAGEGDGRLVFRAFFDGDLKVKLDFPDFLGGGLRFSSLRDFLEVPLEDCFSFFDPR
mmetsp:Transcript_37855/g.88493  ORF Transcript_37855/g.88493 Transcript_37855/m.88493 type:complete len:304 (-) Transcript_37855:1797-2708(-)